MYIHICISLLYVMLFKKNQALSAPLARCHYYCLTLSHTCHILPHSGIVLGLCLAAFAGSGGIFISQHWLEG